MSSFSKAIPYFPDPLREALRRMPLSEQARVQEIRLRIGRPVQLLCGGQAYLLARSGGYALTASECMIVNRMLLDTVFQCICEHSVHSYQQEIRQGFVTIAGGSRVGLAASAVLQNGIPEQLRYLNGMNVRIACEVQGCAQTLADRVFASGACGLLLVGAPASGKTTMLRDLCRILGERYRISLIDERGELAAMHHGESPFALGTQTDVFDGYPKAIGIGMAVRVMSPQILVCDELGSAEETEALLPVLHTGVHLIASAHAGSLPELSARPQMKRLLEGGAFSYLAMLGTGTQCGQVLSVRTVGRTL